ncbi:MAG: hypothetical protein ACOC6S_00975 [Chloroflexota bacterium]
MDGKKVASTIARDIPWAKAFDYGYGLTVYSQKDGGVIMYLSFNSAGEVSVRNARGDGAVIARVSDESEVPKVLEEIERARQDGE